MSEQTENVRRFIKENLISPVISGAAFEQGGGQYKLANGKCFRFTLEEVRSMGAPRWEFSHDD